MSDTDYAELESDVGLEEENQDLFQPKQEWLKMTKGQVLRGSFVYFHTVDVKAVTMARKAKKDISKDEMVAVGKAAIEKRAQELGKAVDQLTDIDRLDLSEVHFKNMQAHYQDGLGYVLSRLKKDGPDADSLWMKLPEPKMYFTTVFLVYPTDSKGNIDKDGLRQGNWKVLPWRFGRQMYENIWKLNEGLRGNGLSIASQDVKLECKDAKYQNIAISGVGPALWPKSENFKTNVLTQALLLFPKLVPFKKMSTDELRSKLGLGGSASADVAAGTDLSDLLDSV